MASVVVAALARGMLELVKGNQGEVEYRGNGGKG